MMGAELTGQVEVSDECSPALVAALNLLHGGSEASQHSGVGLSGVRMLQVSAWQQLLESNATIMHRDA